MPDTAPAPSSPEPRSLSGYALAQISRVAQQLAQEVGTGSADSAGLLQIAAQFERAASLQPDVPLTSSEVFNALFRLSMRQPPPIDPWWLQRMKLYGAIAQRSGARLVTDPALQAARSAGVWLGAAALFLFSGFDSDAETLRAEADALYALSKPAAPGAA